MTDRAIARYLLLAAYDDRCDGPVPSARERWAHAQSAVRREDRERGVVRLRRCGDVLEVRSRLRSRIDVEPELRLRLLMAVGS